MTSTSMTTSYRISNRVSGADLGVYEAATPAEAFRAMRRDAGYRSDYEAARALGVDADTLDDDLVAEPVTESDIQGHVTITHESGVVDTYYIATEIEAAKAAMRAAGIAELPVLRGEGADEIATGAKLFA